MNRILFSLFLLVGLSFGGQSDSIKIIALSAKVDSIARQLEMQHFEASTTKELYLKTNDNLHSQMGTITNWSAGIAAGVFAFLAILAVVNYRIQRHEVDAMGIQMEQRITTTIAGDRELLSSSLSTTTKTLSDMETSVKNRNEEALKKIDEEISKISNTHAKSINSRLDIKKNEAIGEALLVLNKYGLAAKHLSLAGKLLFETRPTGYEEEVRQLAGRLVEICKSARQTGWGEAGTKQVVAEFSGQVGHIDQNIQQRLQEALNQ